MLWCEREEGNGKYRLFMDEKIGRKMHENRKGTERVFKYSGTWTMITKTAANSTNVLMV